MNTLMADAEKYGNQEIEQSKKDGSDYDLLYSKIVELSNRYAESLNKKIGKKKC